MYCIEEKTYDIVATFRRPPVIRRPGIEPPTLRPCCDTSRQRAQLWISQRRECRTTSPNSKNTTKVSWAMYSECPTKDWWVKPCWLNPREGNPDVVRALGGAIASPTLLGPVLMWSQPNYLKLPLTVRCSKVYGCCPRNSPWRKRGHENELNEYLR